MDFSYYLNWFDDYVSRHLNSDEDDKLIILKKNHTLRVLDEARGILGSLQVSEHLNHLIQLAALFHDLGRFPQLAKYHTFRDAESVNHATEGLKVLLKEGILKNLSLKDRKIVYNAVQFHNRAVIPENLPHDNELALNVLRDADKLDILNVLLRHLKGEESENESVTLDLLDQPTKFTPQLLQATLNRQIIKYNHLVYINDFIILLMGWIYNFNFTHSMKVLKKRGMINELYKFLDSVPDASGLDVILNNDLDRMIAQGVISHG